MSRQVIIVGASVRAAAESAAAAGYDVHAYDLFADADLRRIATATRIAGQGYPECLLAALDDVPPTVPWLYTGGIENYSRLIAELGKRRRLLGNPAAVVQRVRDPSWLTNVATSAGWQVPQTMRGPTPGAIRKRRHHCGGLGARRVVAGGDADDSRFLFQQFVPGPVYGGLFLGDPARGRSLFLGATRQFTAGDLPPHPLIEEHPFAYAGSEGPIDFDAVDVESWRALGRALSAAVPLRGLYGVDAIKNAKRGWVLLELNPRWTASIELIERAYSYNAFPYHVAACLGESLPPPIAETEQASPFVKRIVYATNRLQVDQSLVQRINRLKDMGVSAHDLPLGGTIVEARHPLMTLIASGTTIADAKRRLENAVETLADASKYA